MDPATMGADESLDGHCGRTGWHDDFDTTTGINANGKTPGPATDAHIPAWRHFLCFEQLQLGR
jgi:hypothetical protein